MISALTVKATPVEGDADVLVMTASDQTPDRYDEVILAAGWQLEDYQKNPVVQYDHNYSVLATIGRAEKTWVEGNALIQRWRFAASISPVAAMIRDLYRAGFLHASSVGFIPLKWEDGQPNTGVRRRYTAAELIEVSAVAIPANPNALAQAVKDGAVEGSTVKAVADQLAELHRQFSVIRPPSSPFSQTEPVPQGDARTAARDDEAVRGLKALTLLAAQVARKA